MQKKNNNNILSVNVTLIFENFRYMSTLTVITRFTKN
jgi:hypothetical protein